MCSSPLSAGAAGAFCLQDEWAECWKSAWKRFRSADWWCSGSVSLLPCNGQVCGSSKIRLKYRSVQARHLFICIQAATSALYIMKFLQGHHNRFLKSQCYQLHCVLCSLAQVCQAIECPISVIAVSCIKYCWKRAAMNRRRCCSLTNLA